MAGETHKSPFPALFRVPNFRHSFIGSRPNCRAAGMAEIRTFLPFTGDAANGASCQKPTLNVRPSGIWERRKLGRLPPVSIQAERFEKLTFDRAVAGPAVTGISTLPRFSIPDGCRSFTRPRCLPSLKREAGDQHQALMR